MSTGSSFLQGAPPAWELWEGQRGWAQTPSAAAPILACAASLGLGNY